MSRKYFGTDGVRGRVGEVPMTVDFAMRLASAAARVLAPQGGTALIGKDTRVSGYLFESAMEAGFVAAGVDVLLTGPLPTPAIAYLTRRIPRAFGVVISASHNPYEDNGIKFFDADGGKLSDEIEARIEAEMAQGALTQTSDRLGRARRADHMREDYQRFCASTVAEDFNLSGMKIVIDCANGAGYKVGPRLLADLGADIIPVGCSPNGRNINDGCGSTSPGLLQLTVPGVGAAVGIALDGDGDRLVMVDHLGRVLDGDQLLYIIARARHEAGTLNGPVVGTVMSNLGLEIALRKLGIEFHRAKVGDRYVMSKLKECGGVLGGETSGHILCLDQRDHRRCAGHRAAGAGTHEADRSFARAAGRGHVEVPPGAAEREDRETVRCHARCRGAGRRHGGGSPAGRSGPRRAAPFRHRARHPRDGGGQGRG